MVFHEAITAYLSFIAYLQVIAGAWVSDCLAELSVLFHTCCHEGLPIVRVDDDNAYVLSRESDDDDNAYVLSDNDFLLGRVPCACCIYCEPGRPSVPCLERLYRPRGL